MENFSLISLLISIPVMIAIDRGLLRIAFILFLLANLPMFVLLIFDYDFGAGLIVLFRLIILLFSFYLLGKFKVNVDA